jgi:hypothetical protein
MSYSISSISNAFCKYGKYVFDVLSVFLGETSSDKFSVISQFSIFCNILVTVVSDISFELLRSVIIASSLVTVSSIQKGVSNSFIIQFSHLYHCLYLKK